MTTTTKTSFLATLIKTITCITLLLLSTVSWGQTTITVGSGTNQGNRYPVAPYFWYTYSQQIVLKTDVNTAGLITKLRFYSTGTALTNSNNWTIYLGHTSKTAFSSNTDWIASSAMTQVFSGIVPTPSTTAGWYEIDINDVFVYNNTDNLVIAVDENATNYTGSSATNYFRIWTTPVTNRGIYVTSDSSNPDPTAISSISGTRTSYIAQMQLELAPAPTCYSPTALTSSLITYQTATIGWTVPTSGTSPAGYEYEVRTSGVAGSGATGLVTSGTTTAPTTSVSLTGLIGATAYTYYVRSDCGGGDYSSWSSGTFTTTSCSVPTAVTSSAITTTTATISWTAPSGSPAGYEYEVRTSGAAGSGSTGLIASGTTTAPTVSANLTGLTSATSYSVYVRTNCYSGFNSSWTSAVTFATLCNSVTTLPFTESFEGITTGIPICWGIAGNLASSSSYHFSSSASGQTGRGLIFNSFSSSSGSTSELITPTLDLTSLSTAELKFWFKNPTGGNFEVLISTDNGANYTSLQSSLTGQTAWLQKSYTITSYISSTVKIKFKGTSNYGSGDAYVYLDEIIVQAIPTCFNATALTSTAITYQTATIGWTAPTSGTSPAGYEYEVRTSGAAGSGATGLVTSGTTTAPTTSVSLTGLTGGTSYTYYVRSNCGGGDYSSWSSGTFTTTSCSVPTAVTSSAITTTTATISWTAPSGSPAGYEYEVRTSGAAGSGNTGLVTSGTTTAPTVSANLTGLTASTSYSVYVRTNCYSGFNSSWTSVISFNTLQIPATLPYFDDMLTNNFIFVNETQNNKWSFGSAVGNSGNSIYISNNNGLNNSYNPSSSSTSHAYRDIIIPAGVLNAKFSFNWMSYGEAGYDYGRVWLVPVSFTPSAGTQITSGSGRIQVGGNFLLQSNWQSYSNNSLDISSFANSTLRLVFEWRNDGSGGSNPPFAIDNISFSILNEWTGTTSNSWNTASNWSLNTVPTTSDNIVINSNGTNAPVMDVDVTIPAGKSLTISGTGTLTIAPGKVLTIAGTADFGGKLVTFKSDATGTGMLGTLTGTLTGANNVKVERFIPQGKRAFRLLSPAVTTTTFISGNWQQQTHITGGASGGFDVTETNNPSMFTYNNNASSGSGWTAIANTNATNLTAGVGYRMLVRGDRTATNITAATTDNMNAAVTLSATGTLKTGTVTLNSSSIPAINNTSNTTTADFSLVGNPYQSAVDWNAVTKSGIDATYWAWDPNMGTSTQRGRYVAFNGTTNDNNLSQVGQFIQPGQAFFVKNSVSGTAGTLTFQEAHKATTSASVFRMANQNTTSAATTLSVQLYEPNELAIGGYPIDAMKAIFNVDYQNDLGTGDATKLESAGENIAWFRNNTKLAIDAASPLTETDELLVKTLRLGANKNYVFKIQTTSFDSNLTPYLVDNFLNTQTEISTSQAFTTSFATTTNAASYNENRFKIVFTNAALATDTFATQIGLYPNPTKGNGFNLQLPSATPATVNLYNMLGQEISITANGTYYQANQPLSTGMYHVKVTQGTQTSTLKWIVK